MKRVLEADLPSPAGYFLTDLLPRITEIIDSPIYADIKAYLQWHATCRSLWAIYSAMGPAKVESMLLEKHWSLRDNTTLRFLYATEYYGNLINSFYRIQLMNETMLQKLHAILPTMIKTREARKECDPMKTAYLLGKLEEFDSVVNFWKGTNPYARWILLHSSHWFKVRYGWDIRVVKISKDGSFEILPPAWEKAIGGTTLPLGLVICNNKFQ